MRALYRFIQHRWITHTYSPPLSFYIFIGYSITAMKLTPLHKFFNVLSAGESVQMLLTHTHLWHLGEPGKVFN